MGSRIKKHTEIKTEDLNLIPVMNLVTILIPFALLSAQFVHLAVIDSSLPAIGQPQPMQEEPEKPPLTLKFVMTATGFTLDGGAATLPEFPGAYFPPEDAPKPEEGEEVQPTFSVVPALKVQDMCKGDELEDLYLGMSRCFEKSSADPCGLRRDSVTGQPVCKDLATAVEHPWWQAGEFIEKIKEEYPDDENVILVPDPDIVYNDIVNLMDLTRERIVESEDGGKETAYLFPNVVLAGGVTQ